MPYYRTYPTYHLRGGADDDDDEVMFVSSGRPARAPAARADDEVIIVDLSDDEDEHVDNPFRPPAPVAKRQRKLDNLVAEITGVPTPPAARTPEEILVAITTPPAAFASEEEESTEVGSEEEEESTGVASEVAANPTILAEAIKEHAKVHTARKVLEEKGIEGQAADEVKAADENLEEKLQAAAAAAKARARKDARNAAARARRLKAKEAKAAVPAISPVAVAVATEEAAREERQAEALAELVQEALSPPKKKRQKKEAEKLAEEELEPLRYVEGLEPLKKGEQYPGFLQTLREQGKFPDWLTERKAQWREMREAAAAAEEGGEEEEGAAPPPPTKHQKKAKKGTGLGKFKHGYWEKHAPERENWREEVQYSMYRPLAQRGKKEADLPPLFSKLVKDIEFIAPEVADEESGDEELTPEEIRLVESLPADSQVIYDRITEQGSTEGVTESELAKLRKDIADVNEIRTTAAKRAEVQKLAETKGMIRGLIDLPDPGQGSGQARKMREVTQSLERWVPGAASVDAELKLSPDETRDLALLERRVNEARKELETRQLQAQRGREDLETLDLSPKERKEKQAETKGWEALVRSKQAELQTAFARLDEFLHPQSGQEERKQRVEQFLRDEQTRKARQLAQKRQLEVTRDFLITELERSRARSKRAKEAEVEEHLGRARAAARAAEAAAMMSLASEDAAARGWGVRKAGQSGW